MPVIVMYFLQKVRDITPCNSVEVYRRFGKEYLLHLKGRRVNEATDICLQPTLYFFGLLCEPEEGGDTFHGKILPDYTP
jgi:hypothetical protein